MKAGVKLTKPGLSFLGLIALFYHFTLISEIGLLFVIIGLIIGCYAVNLASAYRTIRNIAVGDIGTIRSVEESNIDAGIEITNNSKTQSGFLTFKSSYGTLFKLSSIPGKSRRHVSPELIFHKRGVYEVKSLTVESRFPFGLIKVYKALSARGEFIVYPSLYECRPPKASGFEPMFEGSFSGKHKAPYGNEFAGIRPFQSGDSVKQIQWKASSKGLGLMVKEYTEALSGKISFFIDPRNIILKNNQSIGDLAVRAAGSLILAALDEGHNIEVSDITLPHILHVPPFADPDVVLEYLARLKDTKGACQKDKFDSIISSMSRISSVCFILCAEDKAIDESLYSLLNLGRTVNVYLPNSALEYKSDTFRISEKFIANLITHGARVKFYSEDSIV